MKSQEVSMKSKINTDHNSNMLTISALKYNCYPICYSMAVIGAFEIIVPVIIIKYGTDQKR